MKKVLFIDYFFPPLLASQHAMAFAKHLSQCGWEPIVICAAESVPYAKDYSLLNGLPEDLHIHRVAHRMPSSLFRYFRRKLKIAADFPDYYRTWCAPAYREAQRIMRKEKIDLIYSASPSFTAHFVAMKLKRESSLPWVADFADGWAVNDFLNDEFARTLIGPMKWFHKRRVKNAERSILTLADQVVCVHSHVIGRWRELHGLSGSNMHVVTDGYDESAFDEAKPSPLYPGKPTVLFLGTYYPHFRETIQKFARAIYEVGKGAELIFIGRTAAPVQEMGLPNATCIMHLPKKKAIALALGASFLLLIMPPYAKWTPMKTYDYLRIGKPILGLVPADGDPAGLIQQAKAGFVLPFDEQEMREKLKEILGKWKRGDFDRFRPNPRYVNKFEWGEITRQMAEVFDAA